MPRKSAFASLVCAFLAPCFVAAADNDDFVRVPSPDGKNCFYTLAISEPLPQADTQQEIGLIVGRQGRPFAFPSPDYDPVTAAWTGSSKYLVISGQKYGPNLLAYRHGTSWLTIKLDDRTLVSLGEKLVPYRDLNAPTVHEAVRELRSGPGDSVIGLYYKNQDPQAVIITFLLRIHEQGGQVRTQFEIRKVIPLKSPAYPLPSLQELEKG